MGSKGHINNLYNTTFWALVQKGGMLRAEAEETLKVPCYLPYSIEASHRPRAGKCGRRQERDSIF